MNLDGRTYHEGREGNPCHTPPFRRNFNGVQLSRSDFQCDRRLVFCQSKRRNGYDSANSILYDGVVHPGAFGDERTMEYSVKAETKEGDVITLRRGFPSRSDAEDYPVRLSLWRRVWVERELSEPTPAS
jgi:hypothetical protein